CHLPLGGRLFVSIIITQIGRENKFSAEIFACQFSDKNAERKTRSFLTKSAFCGRNPPAVDEIAS
ncbi:MAG: hypothetical protein IKM18_04525, partial [Clostridia bacterium]|nr:hypothetical protein [Clostridia bacterium]